MRVIILAGGRGTRLSEETTTKPKPLVEVAGRPLVFHIMNHFSFYGFKEFLILAGYKGDQLRSYFENLNMDISIDFQSEIIASNKRRLPDWKIRLKDTGLYAGTGGRLLQVAQEFDDDVFITYGDGIADIDLRELLKLHRKTSKIVTITAVRPPARFGALELNGDSVLSFVEKPVGDNSWVNGGFFVVKKSFFEMVRQELSIESMFELDLLPKLTRMGQVGAYRHEGFWQPVDTIRDLELLESRLKSSPLPWIE